MKTKTFKVGDLILAKEKTSKLCYLVKLLTRSDSYIAGQYKLLTYHNGEKTPSKCQINLSNAIGFFDVNDYNFSKSRAKHV